VPVLNDTAVIDVREVPWRSNPNVVTAEPDVLVKSREAKS
jgi:hypothetical protein